MRCEPGCDCGRHYDRGEISIKARHKRVWKARGKATAHLCVLCVENNSDNPARDWATVHGADGYDPWADYVPLCRPHHRRYDRIGPRQRKAKSIMAHNMKHDDLGRFVKSNGC